MLRKTLALGAALLACSALLPENAFGQAKEKIPPEWGKKLDWQNWADVYTLPAVQNAAAWSDGNLKTTATLASLGEAGSEITLRFQKPLDATMFRFVQTSALADHYKLLADVEGKGKFTDVIADRKDDKAIRNEWIQIPVGKKVFGLKFVAVSGQIGYRSSFPNISEIEIYTKDTVRVPVARSSAPVVSTLQPKPFPALDKRNIDVRICHDWWNFSMDGWEKVREKTPLADWEGFKNTVDRLKELDANSVRLFGESDAGDRGRMPFPSKLVEKEFQRDWMKPFTDEMKKNGYPVYYFSHAWKPPFQIRGKMAPSPWCRWDYPYQQSDTLVGVNENYKVTYPCVICNDEFRLKWTQMMREALQNGAKGIYLMPDEYFFKGHNLSRANCPDCTREFKKMFGFDSMPKLKAPANATNANGQVMPPLPEDTEQYRKWKLFEYIKLAELFSKISADLKKEFPNAVIVNTDNQGAAANGRLEHTVCNEIIGLDPNADFKQVYGADVNDRQSARLIFTKRFEAAAGKKKLLSSAGWGPADIIRPTEHMNAILPQIMAGASVMEIYRQNYMYMGNGLAVYKKIIRMIRLLEKWGIQEAEIPEPVCMLYSRAGEDWYFTRITAMMSPDKKSAAVEFFLNLADESINKIISTESDNDRERVLAQDRVRGYGATNTMESLLASSGIPYKVAYTERPDNMKNLKRFKAVVIPFAYSMSKEAFAEVKAAQEAGTKIILFEQLAPTDEFGNKYEKPLLEELVGKPGVTFIKDSLAETSADLKKHAAYRKLINDAIKDDGYFFDANGFPVEYIVTKLPGDKGYILYLCNIAERPLDGNGWKSVPNARVVIGLPANGDYKMETFSSDSCDLSANALNHQETFTPDMLKKFSISVAPQEVKLVHIYR